MRRIDLWTVIGICFFILFLEPQMVWSAAAPAPGNSNESISAGFSDIDANELLEAGPVDQYTLGSEATSSTAASEYTPLTPETLSPGDPYPIAGAPSDYLVGNTRPAACLQQQILPWLDCAYIPDLDWTEVNLGLLLNIPPGIGAGLTWGAMRNMMLETKITVQSTSYTAGINARYALREELLAESKPAIAATFGWRFVNFRTNNEERETIFRGNRILAGAVFSKWLGSLARSLELKKELQDFMDHLKVHIAVLMEFQTGRRYAAEEAFTAVEFGARTSLEITLDSEFLFLTLTYDSLPDWLGSENYYLGVRYLARRDFAVDVLGGRIGNDYGLTIALAWIF